VEYLLPIAFVAYMVWFLAMFLRAGEVSPWKTRGARDRLRRPNPDTVTPLVGFRPPSDLVPFFENAPFLERQEFQLTEQQMDGNQRWIIGKFIPLTGIDVREALFISGEKGVIPIAWDMDKGVYVVTPNGAVVLRSPDVAEGEVRVADNPTQLLSFQAAEISDDSDDTTGER
jgi:hypothetical protein